MEAPLKKTRKPKVVVETSTPVKRAAAQETTEAPAKRSRIANTKRAVETPAPVKRTTKRAATQKTTEAPAKRAATTSTKSATTPNDINILLYITRISKQYNNDVGVYKNLKSYLQDVVFYWLRNLVNTSKEKLSGKVTVQERHLITALEELLPENDVRANLLKYANNVLERYTADKKSVTFYMSKPRVCKLVKTELDSLKISDKGLVFLTALVESIVVELTTAANEFSKKKERSNIVMDDIMRALKNNEQLMLLTNAVPLPEK